MLFCDGQQGTFPRTCTSDVIKLARNRDQQRKLDWEQDVNASKFRKNTVSLPGDKVMMQNHKKKSMFDLDYFPEPFTVLDTSNEGPNLLIQQDYDGSVYRWHPDMKPFTFIESYSPVPSISSEKDAVQKFHQCLAETSQDNTDGNGNLDLATDIPRLKHQHASFEPRWSTCIEPVSTCM